MIEAEILTAIQTFGWPAVLVYIIFRLERLVENNRKAIEALTFALIEKELVQVQKLKEKLKDY